MIVHYDNLWFPLVSKSYIILKFKRIGNRVISVQALKNVHFDILGSLFLYSSLVNVQIVTHVISRTS